MKRITRKVNGETVNTTALILTFDKTTYPKHVKVGLLRVATKPYYPNPMLCFGCFKYGHPKSRCTKPRICYNCSESHHGDECSKQAYCLNCEGSHRPGNRTCPVYKHEEKIVHTKIDLNLTYPEARERVDQGNSTYAQAAAQNRLDQQKLDNLLKAVQQKDEQISKLMELNKSKDQKITELEQKLTKMHNILERELREKFSKNPTPDPTRKPIEIKDLLGLQSSKEKRPSRKNKLDEISPERRSRSPILKTNTELTFDDTTKQHRMNDETDFFLSETEVLNEEQKQLDQNLRY